MREHPVTKPTKSDRNDSAFLDDVTSRPLVDHGEFAGDKFSARRYEGYEPFAHTLYTQRAPKQR